jgi:enediyne biosynthesis protein E4
MISGAAWANLTGDSKKELVVAGEYMAPRIFSFQDTGFTEVKSNLDSLAGYWQSLHAEDLDGDGDMDLVLGNIGENFYLRADSRNPVKLWMYDFDGNGTAEKIMTRTWKGKDRTVFLKKDLTDQIAILRKENLKYADYAAKSIQDLFPAEVLKKSEVKWCSYTASCIALNNGDGSFSIQKLPPNVQFSSVNAIASTDLDADGRKDLVLGGNIFGVQPQFSRLDASYGAVILNKGGGQFEYLPQATSGLSVRGAVRSIVAFRQRNRLRLLFLQNNDRPVLYEVKTN